MAPRITLITGCSSGIGLATAVKLAQDPDKSYLVYASMRNLAKKDELENAAGSTLNDTLFVHELDIDKEDQIVSTVKHITDKHGRIDVLINNAACSYRGTFEDMGVTDMRKMIETNVIGAFSLTQKVIPIMKGQRSGRIINISSLAGIVGFPFIAVYSASKFALEGLTESLYPELRCFGVWICTICPGPVKTKMIGILIHDKESSQELSPTNKLMTDMIKDTTETIVTSMQEAEDIANVIIKCLSSDQPRVRYETGSTVPAFMRSEGKFIDGIGAVGAEAWYDTLLRLTKQ